MSTSRPRRPVTPPRANRARSLLLVGGARGLVLEGELLARVDGERRIGRQDRIAADILVDEVERVGGDVFAAERERLLLERESLDDVQLGAMRDLPGEAARLESDRVHDERVAV